MKQDFPQKNKISDLLSKAFSYWSRTLPYQIMFSLLYISMFITVLMFALDYYGVSETYADILNSNPTLDAASMTEVQKKLQANPNVQTFDWFIVFTLAFLFPLNMGLFKMFRKIDLGGKPSTEDLFAGYRSINFFIYTSYFLFWILVLRMSMMTVILGFVWIAITIFSAPLMFFQNRKMFETIRLNIGAWRNYFPEILVASLVAIGFKTIGMLSLIGIPFVYGFSNAMVYTLYQEIFRDPLKSPK